MAVLAMTAGVWALAMLFGVVMLLNYRPEPELAALDMAVFKHQRGTTYWLHVLAGYAACLAITGLLWRSRVPKWVSATVTLLIGVGVAVGHGLASQGMEREGGESYRLHLYLLPLAMTVGFAWVVFARVRALRGRESSD